MRCGKKAVEKPQDGSYEGKRSTQEYVRNYAVPTGLASIFRFTRHSRAGLSYTAATRLAFGSRSFHRCATQDLARRW